MQTHHWAQCCCIVFGRLLWGSGHVGQRPEVTLQREGELLVSFFSVLLPRDEDWYSPDLKTYGKIRSRKMALLPQSQRASGTDPCQTRHHKTVLKSTSVPSRGVMWNKQCFVFSLQQLIHCSSPVKTCVKALYCKDSNTNTKQMSFFHEAWFTLLIWHGDSLCCVSITL